MTDTNTPLIPFETYRNTVVLNSNEFKTENDFCNYIELNLPVFITECLNLKYKSHTRELRLEASISKRSKKHKRIDFLVKTDCGKTILIELKNPVCCTSTAAGIGQLLDYSYTYRLHKGFTPDMLVLLTTTFEPTISETIKFFNLPILYIAMDKEKFLFSSINHFNN